MSRLKDIKNTFIQKNLSRVKQLKSHYGEEYVNANGLPIIEDENGEPKWVNRAERRKLAKMRR